ncbi:MAG TPA: p-hydroxycinnamoyl CoA hydratase/lyase [Alphaproteobacteria bacterium]|jgi:trans-feruloyl-CoA hydratase/vanillin synthase|nr:p-hydroxycinnamoyl CoA hydratase/lyase [Alphaproteobacteria bacterium]
MASDTSASAAPVPGGKTVLVEFDDGIAWVRMNRPEKRNAISAELAYEMFDVIDALEVDERCRVVVLTGSGEAFSAGMDLRDYFRASDKATPVERARLFRTNAMWQWRRLLHYPKPTIAMVNGWCFGGAFTPLVACDLAIAAEDAIFGLSEINWGIIPGGVVSKAITEVLGLRQALYYVMTGENFDGRKAASIGLVNEAVPADRLRARTAELARVLMNKNPSVLRQAKIAVKYARDMSWDEAAEYLAAKSDQTIFQDPERGREQGMKQFLDEKSYRPGLGGYKRDR